jgi:hypothetical protein
LRERSISRDTRATIVVSHPPRFFLYEVQKYFVIRRVRGNDPVRADAYRRQCLRLAEGLG